MFENVMNHLQTVFFDHYFCINRDFAFLILLFYKQKFGDTALKNPTRENPEYYYICTYKNVR